MYFFENIQSIKSKIKLKTRWPWIYENRPTQHYLAVKHKELNTKELSKRSTEEHCIFDEPPVYIHDIKKADILRFYKYQYGSSNRT